MPNWGVQSRVIFVALLPMLLVALVLTSHFTLARLGDIEDAYTSRGTAFARQLVAAGEYAVFTDNQAVLQQLVQTQHTHEGITAAAIINEHGRTLAESGALNAELGKPDDVRSTPFASRNGQTLRLVEPILARWILPQLEVDDFPHEPYPVVLGNVVVDLDKQVLEAQRGDMLRTAVGTVLGAILLTLALAIAMSRSVSGPIRRISSSVERIGAGYFDGPVPVVGGGSLRRLSMGVRDMAAQLANMHADMSARIDEATAALRTRTEEAEQANTAKSRFLAAASHDLRQPMHALGLFVSELSQHKLPPPSRRLLEQITTSAQSMEDLLDSLLDISKLDAGVLQPNLRAFALHPVLERLSTAQQPALKAQAVSFRIHPGQRAAWGLSDPVLFERILGNLISNAIRYNPSGRVLVACRRRGRHWRIEVRDNGPGIPQESQAIIFHEFVQLNNPERTREKGLGLGLAIVRRLTQLLDHRLSLQSAPGRGSVFAVDIPCASYRPEQHAGKPRMPGDLTGIHVAIVDDDPLALSALDSLLRSWHCTVTSARDLSKLVSQLTRQAHVPDFVLSDYRLSNHQRGIEVIRTLRGLYRNDLPAALITGDTGTDALTRAKQEGYPVLHKPVRPARLRALIHRIQAAGLDDGD